jgi:hypothetical protein
MKRISICLAVIALSGCTSTMVVPVVKEALQCSVPADMLAACGEPVPIKPGITFGEVIEVTSRDRDSLRGCALRHKSLADAITVCNDNIEKHNADIRELNARNAAKQ